MKLAPFPEDPRTCPASGTVVHLSSPRTSAQCRVCGRRLELRLKPAGRIARWPTHDRLDGEIIATQSCRVEQAIALARDAVRRNASSAPRAVARAIRLAERAPPSGARARRLSDLSTRVTRSKERARLDRAAAMPRDPARIVRALADASELDLGAIEPDTWLEYLATYIPSASLEKLARERSTSWVRLGLEALVRRARPRSWDDLERRSFGGQESVLAVVRHFPGLESIRLPDRAYEAMAGRAELDEVPF